MPELVRESPMKYTVRFAVLLALWILLVMTFWGKIPPSWPDWLRHYSGCAVRGGWRAWTDWVDVSANVRLHRRLVWVLVACLGGVALPALLMRLRGRHWRDVGVRWPNMLGWRYVAIGIGVGVLMAVAFVWERKRLSGVDLPMNIREALLLLASSVPEHLCISGFVLASLLPRERIAKQPSLPARHGILAWLGLGAVNPTWSAWPGLFGWLGLRNWGEVAAISGAALVFGFVHLGARPIELVTSFPGGWLIAYMTLRSGSVLPAWLIHLGQMLAVYIGMIAVGAVRL